jgi:hypothetical protein
MCAAHQRRHELAANLRAALNSTDPVDLYVAATDGANVFSPWAVAQGACLTAVIVGLLLGFSIWLRNGYSAVLPVIGDSIYQVASWLLAFPLSVIALLTGDVDKYVQLCGVMFDILPNVTPGMVKGPLQSFPGLHWWLSLGIIMNGLIGLGMYTYWAVVTWVICPSPADLAIYRRLIRQRLAWLAVPVPLDEHPFVVNGVIRHGRYKSVATTKTR